MLQAAGERESGGWCATGADGGGVACGAEGAAVAGGDGVGVWCGCCGLTLCGGGEVEGRGVCRYCGY